MSDPPTLAAGDADHHVERRDFAVEEKEAANDQSGNDRVEDVEMAKQRPPMKRLPSVVDKPSTKAEWDDFVLQ